METEYNIDSIASKSAIISEKYNNYGLFLKWNHDLWLRQYLENLESLNGAEALGDISMLSGNF